MDFSYMDNLLVVRLNKCIWTNNKNYVFKIYQFSNSITIKSNYEFIQIILYHWVVLIEHTYGIWPHM